MLKSNHHKRVNPAAAPKSGVITIEPLPTTLPVTIALGPINFNLSIIIYVIEGTNFQNISKSANYIKYIKVIVCHSMSVIYSLNHSLKQAPFYHPV